MAMDSMLDSLFAFQKADIVALGIPHPINLNSPGLPIPIVGLFTATGDGLSLADALAIAKRFDSVAMWNTSMCPKASEARISDGRTREYIRDLNQKHVGNRRLWVNQSNFSLASELAGSYGLNTHFETDEHMTLPFIQDERGGYVLGGDSLSAGATVIEIKGRDGRAAAGRPSVRELIPLIRNGTARMHGRVFAVKRSDAITVHSERSAIPDELRHMARKASHALMRRYAGFAVKDFFEMLIEGEMGRIGHMTGR
jgi:hypothetical protein